MGVIQETRTLGNPTHFESCLFYRQCHHPFPISCKHTMICVELRMMDRNRCPILVCIFLLLRPRINPLSHICIVFCIRIIPKALVLPKPPVHLLHIFNYYLLVEGQILTSANQAIQRILTGRVEKLTQSKRKLYLIRMRIASALRRRFC